jgi:hypothetical protein
MASQEGLTLRQKALEALERSTKMLQVAFDLLTQGNQVESARLRKEARKQRTISTLLMAEASRLEINPRTLRAKQFPNPANHKAHSIAAH